MMHYSKNAFRNGTEPTIVTRIPAFSDVIGQRMEFSDSDLLKLNRLYNCGKSLRYYFITSCYHRLASVSCNCHLCLALFTHNKVEKVKVLHLCVDVYVAAQGSTFLESCDFERENICGMIQGEGDQADWIRVSKAAGGPDTDYSNMGKCTGEYTRRVHVTWHSTWKKSFGFIYISIWYRVHKKGGGKSSVPFLCYFFPHLIKLPMWLLPPEAYMIKLK